MVLNDCRNNYLISRAQSVERINKEIMEVSWTRGIQIFHFSTVMGISEMKIVYQKVLKTSLNEWFVPTNFNP